MGGIREFATGATRDQDADKWDFEGFLSPLVVAAYGRYMHRHRQLPDGTLRASDNWQAGIPLDAYVKSGWRHFYDLWANHRGVPAREGIEDACCAVLFNVMGYLHEYLKAKQTPKVIPHEIAAAYLRDRGEQDDDSHNPHAIQFGAGGEVIDVTKGLCVPNYPSNEDGS